MEYHTTLKKNNMCSSHKTDHPKITKEGNTYCNNMCWLCQVTE